MMEHTLYVNKLSKLFNHKKLPVYILSLKTPNQTVLHLKQVMVSTSAQVPTIFTLTEHELVATAWQQLLSAEPFQLSVNLMD